MNQALIIMMINSNRITGKQDTSSDASKQEYAGIINIQLTGTPVMPDSGKSNSDSGKYTK